jgi:hypothetical protein
VLISFESGGITRNQIRYFCEHPVITDHRDNGKSEACAMTVRETKNIVRLLKNRELLWGPYFFCSGLTIANRGMRTRSIVICAKKNQWVLFNCKWRKHEKKIVSSCLSIELREYPPASSGYPHTGVDLNPLNKIRAIDLYWQKRKRGPRQDSCLKAISMRFNKNELIAFFAEDPEMLRTIRLIRGGSEIKRFHSQYEIQSV